MVNGKTKGSQFERDVCKYLNRLTNKEFVRSHIKEKDNKERGDLYCEYYKNIVIECKYYKDPLTFSELFNDSCRLEKWINNILRETKKDWIIFIKTNRAGVIYFTNDINVMISLNLVRAYKKLDSIYFNKAGDFY